MSDEGSSFDAAAIQAQNELEVMLGQMTPDMKQGVLKVVIWAKKWFMTAGLKRLGRILRDLKI